MLNHGGGGGGELPHVVLPLGSIDSTEDSMFCV